MGERERMDKSKYYRGENPPDQNPSGPVVDRCICYSFPFCALRERLMNEGLLGGDDPVGELVRRGGPGGSCGLCIPYLRLTVERGEHQHKPIPPVPQRSRGRVEKPRPMGDPPA